jgi:hypothetical protein
MLGVSTRAPVTVGSVSRVNTASDCASRSDEQRQW